MKKGEHDRGSQDGGSWFDYGCALIYSRCRVDAKFLQALYAHGEAQGR